jgi:hypothetical protein
MLYNNFISNIAKLGKPYTPERAKRESIKKVGGRRRRRRRRRRKKNF